MQEEGILPNSLYEVSTTLVPKSDRHHKNENYRTELYPIWKQTRNTQLENWIHVNVLQKPLQYCKPINLQLK